MIYPPHVHAVHVQKIVQKDGSIETEYVVETDLSLSPLAPRVEKMVPIDDGVQEVIFADDTAELEALLARARQLVAGHGVTRVVVRHTEDGHADRN